MVAIVLQWMKTLYMSNYRKESKYFDVKEHHLKSYFQYTITDFFSQISDPPAIFSNHTSIASTREMTRELCSWEARNDIRMTQNCFGI